MTVKMRGAGGQLSPPVLELASVILERHTVNGALLPIEEELEPGEPMEAQACQSNCADAFETGQTTKTPGGIIRTYMHCRFKSCSSKVINGKKVTVCSYDCTASATTIG
jgi:hypothetical protein